MKKLILLTLLFSTISLVVKAQKRSTFGVKGGINVSNISSDAFYESSSKAGIYLGGLAEFSIGQKFSIQTELLYSRYGANAGEWITGLSGLNSEYTLDYIQIPILAKFDIYRNVSLELGPSINLLIKDKVEYPSNNFTTGSDFANKAELSGILGISYMFKNGLFINARYNQGLTDNISFFSGKNYSFQMGLGFML